MASGGGVRMKWYGPAVIAEADRRMQAKLLAAGEIVRAEAVRMIGTSYHSAGPSAPGEPPHARTGKLRQSLMVKVDGDSVIVGTPLQYGFWLETGTTKMAARPFLRPALLACMDRIKRLLSRR